MFESVSTEMVLFERNVLGVRFYYPHSIYQYFGHGHKAFRTKFYIWWCLGNCEAKENLKKLKF